MSDVLDSFRLDGRVALVTGASRGLGDAMARALASAGADVVLHARAEPASATAAAIASASGRQTALVSGDLVDPDAAERIVGEALSAFGRLDILVNNAGIIRRRAAVEHPDDDWDAVIAVNLSSVRIAPGNANLILGCDIVVATSATALSRAERGVTRAVVNADLLPTASFVINPDIDFEMGAMRDALNGAVTSDETSSP